MSTSDPDNRQKRPDPVDMLDANVDFRRDALYTWLARRYSLVQESIQIADKTVQLHRVDEIDQLLDAVIMDSQDPDAHSPYWSELWPSSIALGQYIAENNIGSGRRILELGCGLGLAGIVCGYDADSVVLSDFEEDSLRIAELNWIANHNSLAETQRVDWNSPPRDETYEIVLASDVAYESRLFQPFIGALHILLAENGQAFLSEPNRPVAKRFFRLLETSGLTLTRLAELPQRETDCASVAIYRVQKR